MDQAYNAHQARRKNRSSTNIQHLSLAPLTTRLPINDADIMTQHTAADILTLHSASSHHRHHTTTSYLQGKSAPTTPSLFTRSPSRPSYGGAGAGAGATTPIHYRHHSGSTTPGKLSKSKSASHLGAAAAAPTSRTRNGARSATRSGTTTPGGHRRGSRREQWEELHFSSASAASGGPTAGASSSTRTNSDWLLRAGVLISSETRESKGQSWLVSRASSTSLGGARGEDGSDGEEDGDPDAFGRGRLARENAIASRHASRRGSLGLTLDDDHLDLAALRSRTGSRSQVVTPGERLVMDSYFTHEPSGVHDNDTHNNEEDAAAVGEEYLSGPDFVNLNEKLEALGMEADAGQLDEDDDEAAVRQLVNGRHGRPHTWFGNIIGWNLFSVEEKDEEDDDEDDDDDEEEEEDDSEAGETLSDVSVVPEFEGMTATSSEQQRRLSPPKADDGSWQDAAWLLSVASKVAWS